MMPPQRGRQSLAPDSAIAAECTATTPDESDSTAPAGTEVGSTRFGRSGAVSSVWHGKRVPWYESTNNAGA